MTCDHLPPFEVVLCSQGRPSWSAEQLGEIKDRDSFFFLFWGSQVDTFLVGSGGNLFIAAILTASRRDQMFQMAPSFFFLFILLNGFFPGESRTDAEFSLPPSPFGSF